MLNMENFRVRTKREFNHNVAKKGEINDQFTRLEDCIKKLDHQVSQNVQTNRKAFLDKI